MNECVYGIFYKKAQTSCLFILKQYLLWQTSDGQTRRWCPEKFRDSLTTPTATIPKIFHGLLFRSTLWMFLQNLKSVYSFTRSWDNRGTQKNWASPAYTHAPFSPKFLWAFIRIGTVNVLAKFEVRSFACSRDNRGYPKNLDSPWIRPRSIFSEIFNGLLFGMTI